jgi:hypothetical protein
MDRRSYRFPLQTLVFCCAASLCQAQTTAAAPAANPIPPESQASAARSAAPGPGAPKLPGKIYQQRQKDGSILFTDRPADTGGVTERSWTVPVEDPEVAEKRREKARQEAKQEAQAMNERLQRQIERQQDRDEALAIERLRLNQAQAQRDAEIARAERERSERERAAAPPLIVVVPGGHPPRQHNPPVAGLPPPYVARPDPPPPPRPSAPSASLCTAKKASDCIVAAEPGRSGVGGR